MDLELNDPWILKCNVLQLLINNPNGVRFGDFIGAFYQIHHFHPQLSHYGYSSLRHLLDDMRETVVVEGRNSCDPVMKPVNDFKLDDWMDKNNKKGLDSFKEDDPKLMEEERREKQEERAAADLAKVLAAITNLLIEYPSGLKIKKIQKFLLSQNGIDLDAFSITKGYKDVLMFLADQIPNLIIRRQGTIYNCVVQLSEDLTVVFWPIYNILQLYPDGLKLSKLKEAVKKKYRYDLEVFCHQVGYDNMVSCLQEFPELVMNKNKDDNWTVRLKLVLRDVMASLTAVLSRYKMGLKVKKLQEFLLAEEGIDLGKFSILQGCKDTVEFLEQKMPHLKLNYQTCRLNSVVELGSEAPVPLLESIETADSLNSAPASFSSLTFKSNRSPSFESLWSVSTSNNSDQDEPEKKYVPLLESIETSVLQNSARVYFGSSLSQSSYCSSFDSEQLYYISKNSDQDEFETKPVLSEVMASLTTILRRYKFGLKVKKLQEILLAEERIDLEKFSIAQGHKGIVEFLEQKMPQLMLNYRMNSRNTVVIEPYSVLIPAMASITNILSRYNMGLRVKKLQDFLLTEEGIDLEKISIALNHKDTVELLEKKMPQLMLKYKTNRRNTVVIDPHSDNVWPG